MKRFATHRVYSLLTAEIKSSQVLELEEDGRVSKLYPFTEEISATEWLPGLVVLSPCPIWKNPEENFSEFKMRISKIPVCEAALRAYWIYPFNVALMEFARNSRITLLK